MALESTGCRAVRSFGRTVLIVLVSGQAGSCSTAKAVREEPKPSLRAHHVSTRSLLQQAAEYGTWDRFEPHRTGPVKSKGHDRLWFVAHYNDRAADAVSGRRARFPEGSIIVGENRVTPEGPPVLLTTMVKQAGGWRFIGHEAGGRVLETGDLDRCRGCHERAARDLVFGARPEDGP